MFEKFEIVYKHGRNSLKYAEPIQTNPIVMQMNVAIFFFILGLMLIEALPPTSNERSALVQQQAQEDYKHHQDVLSGKNIGSASKFSGGYNEDGSFGVTFDNNDKNYRDRGYGYEKAYAYSRETAFFDFLDDKPSLDAKDIVEKYGNSGEDKDEDLIDSITH